MSKIEVFEPALCCATGVCGDDVAQDLVTFSADLDFVRSRGGDVSRYNLASEPLAFADERGGESLSARRRFRRPAAGAGRRGHRDDRPLPRPRPACRLGRCRGARRGRADGLLDITDTSGARRLLLGDSGMLLR